MHFIDEIVDCLLADATIPMERVMVILPNKRAKRFLLNSLTSKIKTPIFSPKIITIEEFIKELSPYQLIDKHELLLILYQIYKNEISEDTSFSKFIGWSSLFLSDIDDVDIQMLNPDDVFQNLKSIKELETSFLRNKLTHNQEKYLEFYDKLGAIYSKLKSILKEKEEVSQGIMYRDVAENVEKYAKFLPYQRFLFAGFHALSPSELKIVEYFYNNSKCDLLFDIDQFYRDQYAPFAAKIQNRLNLPPIESKNDFTSSPKNISIVGASGSLTQIFYAIEELNKIKEKQGNLNDTVLVFADESLLLPFVHAYGTKDVNYTMGYPLRITSAYELLVQIFELCKNSYRFKAIQHSEKIRYYRKDLLAVVKNPLLVPILKDKVSEIKKLSHNPNPFVYKIDFFPNDIIFPTCQSTENFISELRTFFENVNQKLNAGFDKNTVEVIVEHLQATEELVQRFKNEGADLFAQEDYVAAAQMIINEKLSSVTIPFAGDFDQGLQVMGLLETRTLDFKNVIVLSVNENVLPKGKANLSFLMYDIKRYFKMPTHHEKDAIFAYHFFRLLQRASQIHIVYDTNVSDSLKEKSRFIKQLEFELEKQKVSRDIISIEYKNINLQPTFKYNSFSVSKTDEVLDILKQKSFSPSSLSSYILCPMQFYFKHVVELKAEKSDVEEIEDNAVGTLIHRIFETVLVPGCNINEVVSKAISMVETLVDNAIQEDQNLKEVDFSSGKPYLIKNVVCQYVKNYLNKVLQECKNPYEILAVEKELEATLEGYKLYGKADRIDNRNGVIHILDYKSGRVSDNLQKPLENLFSDPECSQLFQLSFYTYLYLKKDSAANVKSGIISLREANIKDNKNFLFFGEIDGGFKLIDFENKLLELLNKICSKDKDFEQVTDESRCAYCDYKEICKKTK